MSVSQEVDFPLLSPFFFRLSNVFLCLFRLSSRLSQINDPVDGLIASAIDSVASLPQPPACLTMDEAKSAGLLHLLSTSQFESYISTILSSVSQPASSKEERSDFGIAYTPLHGVGAPCAEKLLAKSGFSRVFTVKEQREPDGDFPTVSFPSESN